MIPCGGRKLDRRAPAAELYSGSYFAAAYRAARAISDDVVILSGRHGFVLPDVELDPYEQRIDEPGAVTRRELARQSVGLVVKRGGRIYCAADEDRVAAFELRSGVIVLAGAAYAARVIDLFPYATWPKELRNARGIGDHLSYFARLAA